MVLLNHVILPVNIPVNKALCRGSKSSNHHQLFHFACQVVADTANVLHSANVAGHVLEMYTEGVTTGAEETEMDCFNSVLPQSKANSS